MGAHTSLVRDQNIFLLIFLGMLLVLLWRVLLFPRLSPATLHTIMRYRIFHWLLTKRTMKLFACATACVFVTFLTLETYYLRSSCSVSQNYYDLNKQIAIDVIKLMQEHPDRYQFWPDAASLLNVLREEEINPWDHDTDLSMIHPGPARLAELMTTLEQRTPYNVVFLPDRSFPLPHHHHITTPLHHHTTYIHHLTHPPSPQSLFV
eukprot:TRINITY_DN1677_c0_g1_i2.p1 TRINITY_DN1677_c0_g1~~TRINITY_DN1677_c0_g1_i2.p1  ORF type:complete len:206 (-),score=23.84 TRINITY_DN1677_c0_g1_i2:338-955(-)